MISIVIPFKHDDSLVDMTIKLIENVREATNEDHEIIMVHETFQVDAHIKSRVDKYIRIQRADSLAQMYNWGFMLAEGDVFVNMHNDVQLPYGWEERLALAARDGFIGCVLVDESESDCESRGIGKAGNKYIPSCCFSVSSDTWKELKGYDERFKGFHYEDTDLFLRAAHIGHGPVRCDITIKHSRAVTRSLINTAQDEKYQKENCKLYCDKHADLFKERGLFTLNIPPRVNYVKEVANVNS